MPEELKRIMSRHAGAERERRATITKAEGGRLAPAADSIAARSSAMQLLTLQTLDRLGPNASNTVVLAVPIDAMEFVWQLSRPS